MAESRAIWAVVPVKPFALAKRRLAPVLAPDERAALSLCMLEDVLAALRGCPALAGVLVVTGDPLAGAIAREHGAQVLEEAVARGPSAAIAAAAAALAARGAGALVAVPGDVPLVGAADIACVIAAPAAVVVVPARDGDGTNALRVPLPAPFEFAYGAGSPARHLAAARAACGEALVLDLPRLALDIDCPADLQALARWPAGTRTQAWLAGRHAPAAAAAGA